MKLRDIQQEIVKLADEHPNNTANCEYFNMTGHPVCIVGHAVSRLGGNPDKFRHPSINSACFRVNRVREAAGVEDVDLNIIHWIDVVQSVQDEGKTWAEAVAAANENVPDLHKEVEVVYADIY